MNKIWALIQGRPQIGAPTSCPAEVAPGGDRFEIPADCQRRLNQITLTYGELRQITA